MNRPKETGRFVFCSRFFGQASSFYQRNNQLNFDFLICTHAYSEYAICQSQVELPKKQGKKLYAFLLKSL